MSALPASPTVAVIGLGNVFLGDDGFGPLAVEMFRCEYDCDANVEVLDLGTPGLDLAPYLYGKELVVIVDAIHVADTIDGKVPAGTLCIYSEADFVTGQTPLRLTSHDPGVWEALAHVRLADHAPEDVIVVGVVPESCGFGEGISAAVRSSSTMVVDAMVRLLGERGISCRRRTTPIEPNLWWLIADRIEVAVSP